MIEFEDKKYGKVLIYEPNNIKNRGSIEDPLDVLRETIELEYVGGEGHNERIEDVVAYRNIKKKQVIIIVNYYGPLMDYELGQFILNYSLVEEIFDPIESRFDIMDIR